MKKRTSNIMVDALKAVHRLNREQEIKDYGKTICLLHIVRNRKKYTRKHKHKGGVNEC